MLPYGSCPPRSKETYKAVNQSKICKVFHRETTSTSMTSSDDEKRVVTSPRAASLDTSVSSVNSEGYGSSDDHIFKDPLVASHWRDIYEQANYENRHRFDPDLQWTAEEEKKVLRKIDFRISEWQSEIRNFSIEMNARKC